MKKGLLFVAVISAFSFASCKKDRVCTCVETPSGDTNVITYTDAKKGTAAAACLSSTTVKNSVTYTTTCTLK